MSYQHEEKDNWHIQACNCGYDPRRSQSGLRSSFCRSNLAFRNHVSYPSFEDMTDLYDPSLTYYDLSSGMFLPKRHWATLLEIESNISLVRPAIAGFNQFGDLISVFFYHDNGDEPITFEWNDLKKGNTLAILYPEKKTFLDLNMGIRQEVLKCCYLFKSTLSNVQSEAQKLLDNADAKEEKSCFGCGAKSKNFKKCAKCHLATYCSKTCQVNHWGNCHKRLCKQSETLLRLAALPRHRFQDFVTFLDLPPYGLANTP